MDIIPAKLWGIFAGGIVIGGLAVWSFLSVNATTPEPHVPLPAGRVPSRVQKPTSSDPANSRNSKPASLSVDNRLNQLLGEFSEVSSADQPGVNTQLVATLQRVLVENDESRRTLHFNLMLEAMRAQDAPAVAEMFQQLKRQGLIFDPESNFFAQRWGELDPDNALAHIVDGEHFERDGILLDRVLSGWASKSPAAAMHWITEQPDGPLKDTAISGTATGLARNDPAIATRFVLGLPDGGARNRAAHTVFWQVLYKEGMGAARNWFDSLPPDQMTIRNQILPLISARQLLTGDPEAENWIRQRQAAFIE